MKIFSKLFGVIVACFMMCATARGMEQEEQQPQITDDAIVTLKGYDKKTYNSQANVEDISYGEEQKVAYKYAKHSKMIKNLIEDAGIDKAILLSNVSSQTLSKYIIPALKKIEEKTVEAFKTDTLEKVALKELVDITNAANYLDIKKLFDKATNMLENMLEKYFLDSKNLKCFDSADLEMLDINVSKYIAVKMISSFCLYKELTGHTDKVVSVCFSPDGKTLASGSYDKTINLWNVDYCTLIKELKGHTGEVVSVCFSPDGKTLASGSWDKTIKLWNVTTGNLIETLKGHTNGVASVCFSPDGKTLASGSWDKTINLWNVTTGELIETLKGHTDRVGSVCFSPDGKALAAGSSDRGIKLWGVHNGELIKEFQKTEESLTSVCFSPDGKTLASGSYDKNINLWDVSSGELIKQIPAHNQMVTSVCFSPDGKTLASGSQDSDIKLWKVDDYSLIRRLRCSTGSDHNVKIKEIKRGKKSIRSVCFRPDGRMLASGSVDKIIKLWMLKPEDLLVKKEDLLVKKSAVWYLEQGWLIHKILASDEKYTIKPGFRSAEVFDQLSPLAKLWVSNRCLDLRIGKASGWYDRWMILKHLLWKFFKKEGAQYPLDYMADYDYDDE